MKFFYGNIGNPGGLSKCCKICADLAKKRYKLKYNRRSQSNIGIREVPPREKPAERLAGRVQYALLTRKCPRCGGVLQRHVDDFSALAGCMTCLMCSREVWLPTPKEEDRFLSDPPLAVPMPYWVAKKRGMKRRYRSKAGRQVGKR